MAQQWSALFGAEVRYKRVKLGLTQQALAERLGYKTHTTITQIEMGNVVANFEVAIELAKYLPIDLNAILGIMAPVEPEVPMATDVSDPVAVRVLAMLEKLWPWPQAQRAAMVAVWRALADALDNWPEPGTAREPRPGTAEGPGPMDVKIEVPPMRMSGTGD